MQGVGYRMSAQIVAEKLGLGGWVRNLSNGQVEIVAEGQIEQLKQLRVWAWQGPRFAEVTDISVTEQSATGEFDNFKIR